MSEKKPRQCFVIGPIGKPGSTKRKHADMLLNAVIRVALEGCDPPYKVMRADEVSEPGRINDQVIRKILNADLVVADLTFLNANAFYELGIRDAAEKPVIHFAQADTELPFDTIGYRAIMEDITSWEGMEKARRQIREQAKATEVDGCQVSNPITQANASFRMRGSADPTERVLASVLAILKRSERDGLADYFSDLDVIEEDAIARGDADAIEEVQNARNEPSLVAFTADNLRASRKARRRLRDRNDLGR